MTTQHLCPVTIKTSAENLQWFCSSCQMTKGIDRAAKRDRDGIRAKFGRCLDCEALAQKNARAIRGNEINAQRRANWHRHKDKQKNSSLLKTYGISKTQWDEMHKSQSFVCALCQTNEPKGRGWQTDHNHKTGVVRAILCHSCNSMIGHAKESPEILLSAFRYLYSHGGGPEQFFHNHFNKVTL